MMIDGDIQRKSERERNIKTKIRKKEVYIDRYREMK